MLPNLLPPPLLLLLRPRGTTATSSLADVTPTHARPAAGATSLPLLLHCYYSQLTRPRLRLSYVDRAAATASTHGRGDRGVRQFLTAPAKKGRTANTIGYGPLDFKPLFDSGKEPYEVRATCHVPRALPRPGAS